jgi:hypothetical protein
LSTQKAPGIATPLPAKQVFCADVPEDPLNREFSQKAAKITKEQWDKYAA